MGWSSFGQILRRLQKTNNSCDHLNSLLDRGRTNFAIRSILSASLSYQSPIYTAKCENVRHPGRSNSTVLQILVVHGAVYWWCSTTTGRGRERLYDCSVSLIEQQMASRSARTRSYQLFNERLRSLTPNSSRQGVPRPDKILFVLPTNVLTIIKVYLYPCWKWNFVYRTCYYLNSNALDNNSFPTVCLFFISTEKLNWG